MKSSIQKNEKTFLLPTAGIGISLLLILLSNLNALNWLRNGVSYVFEPIQYISSNAGDSVSEYFRTFSRFSEFNAEYNQMKEDILEKDIQNSRYAVILEENEALKKQIKLSNEEKEYVMGKIVSGGDNESLKINVGKRDGILEGDVVSVGDMYVGTIIKADEKGSLVRLPSSRSSNLKVIIVKSSAEDIKKAKVLSRAVVSGSPEGIRIENILMNADIEDGDVVVVNDERVGELLVLGYIVNLSDNPATTSRFGYVSTLVDYDDLMTIFVNID